MVNIAVSQDKAKGFCRRILTLIKPKNCFRKDEAEKFASNEACNRKVEGAFSKTLLW